MLPIIRWGATALVVVFGVLWAVIWVGRNEGESSGAFLSRILGASVNTETESSVGIQLPPGVTIGGPFSLTDHTGKAVTDATYRGKWMLVFFGFTYCPDVCPTELQKVAAVLEMLGDRASQIAPILISIDPERDTPEAMANYVQIFDDRLIGLTGTPEQIAEVARAYRVYYAKIQPSGDTPYLMDHSSYLYLMGPDGRVQAVFPYAATAEDIAAGVAARMARQ